MNNEIEVYDFPMVEINTDCDDCRFRMFKFGVNSCIMYDEALDKEECGSETHGRIRDCSQIMEEQQDVEKRACVLCEEIFPVIDGHYPNNGGVCADCYAKTEREEEVRTQRMTEKDVGGY